MESKMALRKTKTASRLKSGTKFLWNLLRRTLQCRCINLESPFWGRLCSRTCQWHTAQMLQRWLRPKNESARRRCGPNLMMDENKITRYLMDCISISLYIRILSPEWWHHQLRWHSVRLFPPLGACILVAKRIPVILLKIKIEKP